MVREVASPGIGEGENFGPSGDRADGQAAAKKAPRAGPTTRSKRTTPPEGWEPNPGTEGGFVRTKGN